MNEIILSFQEWELYLITFIWMCIPTMIYFAEQTNKRLAILQKKADDSLREWLRLNKNAK